MNLRVSLCQCNQPPLAHHLADLLPQAVGTPSIDSGRVELYSKRSHRIGALDTDWPTPALSPVVGFSGREVPDGPSLVVLSLLVAQVFRRPLSRLSAAAGIAARDCV